MYEYTTIRAFPRRARPRRRARLRRTSLGVSVLAAAALFTWLGLLQAGGQGGAGDPAAPQGPAAALTATPRSTVSPPPGAAEEDWRLTLVNPWNSLPEDYAPALTTLKNGRQVDERCYPDLQAMMDACRAAGLSPVICSAYRTYARQEELFSARVDKLMARGDSKEEAVREAARVVARPGTSEHQLGLAVDLVDEANQNLDESQEKTEVQRWLMEHCWEYGFLLRYPSDKSDVTGIIYEPWHYRYVGREAAAEIRALGVCLEEYLEITRGGGAF